MTITAKHYGSKGGSPSSIIELIVTSHNGSSVLCEDITDSQGNVSIELIDQLKDLIQELEEQNEKIQEKFQSKTK